MKKWSDTRWRERVLRSNTGSSSHRGAHCRRRGARVRAWCRSLGGVQLSGKLYIRHGVVLAFSRARWPPGEIVYFDLPTHALRHVLDSDASANPKIRNKDRKKKKLKIKVKPENLSCLSINTIRYTRQLVCICPPKNNGFTS